MVCDATQCACDCHSGYPSGQSLQAECCETSRSADIVQPGYRPERRAGRRLVARFLTSARAVDMLGRQQIAGIPTALSELFKNAYDAYATEVRADFVPIRNVLLIRDNGVGMSEEDFYNRWLTIGTDSKSKDSSKPPPPRPTNAVPRTAMGEKGIGRLAVASIGPQLVLLTKAMPRGTEQRPAQVLVALIQWSLFEAPGLTLDQVPVPVRLLDEIKEFDREILRDLSHEIRATLEGDHGLHLPGALRQRVGQELELLDLDPAPLLALPGPALAGDSYGTQFLITPVRDDLAASLERPEGEKEASSFQRFLAGFANTMLPARSSPELSARFFVHRPEGAPEDLIDPGSFWTPEDFGNVDHDIDGTFDETGQFQGTVSIYGAAPTPHVVPWVGGKGSASRCGPFRLRIGYVQGSARESRLSPNDYTYMVEKLRALGGLYVYRDGIRVLPYGNSDVDYLKIEERRSLNAGRYYFSYRRMFGAIEVTSATNPDLQEKAGREGFRENAAYRDFRSILEGFLIQLAADFFRSGGDELSQWERERQRLQAQTERRKREQRESKERAAFATRVASVISRLEGGKVREEVAKAVARFRLAVEQLPPNSEGIVLAERAAVEAIDSLRNSLVVAPPGVALTLEVERDYAALGQLREEALRDVIAPALTAIAETVERLGPGAGEPHDLKRLARAESLARGRRTRLDLASRAVEDGGQALLDVVTDLASATLDAFDASTQHLLERASDRTSSREENTHVTLAFEEATDRQLEELVVLGRELNKVAEAIRVGQFGSTELQEQVLDLQEQADSNLELLQLGQAVQIISHELDATIRACRSGLRDLGAWARTNPSLAKTVRDVEASFQHLDTYLRLFTPLQRRLYRTRVAITGDEIAGFLTRLFSERLEREGIKLSVTDDFRSWQLYGFPSTFLPVFVNLLDNAIFWVSKESTTGGQIALQADNRGMLVSDNGPGVPERDRHVIFERGFSRRPAGRGLGLSVARELLGRDGWTLDLDPNPPAGGTTFRISPIVSQEGAQ